LRYSRPFIECKIEARRNYVGYLPEFLDAFAEVKTQKINSKDDSTGTWTSFTAAKQIASCQHCECALTAPYFEQLE
jgi:hypothetical protein